MYLGAEIGGTKLQVGVCDRRGKLVAIVRESVVRREGAPGILRQFQHVIPPLFKRYPVQAIGVGFGGPCDVTTGRAVLSHQIAGWENFPVRHWFEREFGLPVVVDNDQNCAALAEARIGAGQGLARVFYVTVGTGIGGGLVIDGQLYNGRYGAAEIGHMKMPVPGRAGWPSPPPVGRKLRGGGPPRPTNGWTTVESLASGLAIEQGVSTVPQAARHLGAAIANVIAIVNPDIVIVGGGVSTAGAKFWRPLRQTVARLVFPVFRDNYRLVPPQLGQNVVVVGAALLAARSQR